MNIKEIDNKYIANTYARFPLLITKGKGSKIYDENGKEYIDLSTGIAVNTFGIADTEWTDAVISQLNKVQHTSNLYYSEPSAKLAQMLCDRTGMKKVFFSNSGAEANECAIKVARKYSADKYSSDRHIIITLKNSFHGRTITTLAATGQDAFHDKFLPLTTGFLYSKPTISDISKYLANDNIAAIMFETVQGEGGVLPLDKEFVSYIAQVSKEKDILLIVDEVQTGNGRTGKLYSYMNYDISPDIVSTAKGLGGGLPLGATLLGEKLVNTYGFGDHGSTFGGNPIACAGAISIINRIDDNLMNEVIKKHDYIVNELLNIPEIKGISGMGLMLGIETTKDATEVIKECMDKGVIVIKAKNKVRLLPALNIPWEELTKAITILKEVITLEKKGEK